MWARHSNGCQRWSDHLSQSKALCFFRMRQKSIYRKDMYSQFSNVPSCNGTVTCKIRDLVLDQYNIMLVLWCYPPHLVWFCEEKRFHPSFLGFCVFFVNLGYLSMQFRFQFQCSTCLEKINISYLVLSESCWAAAKCRGVILFFWCVLLIKASLFLALESKM